MGGWVPSLPTETALFASVGGEFWCVCLVAEKRWEKESGYDFVLLLSGFSETGEENLLSEWFLLETTGLVCAGFPFSFWIKTIENMTYIFILFLFPFP